MCVHSIPTGSDLVAPNQTIEQLLLKHTRINKTATTILYSKK